MPIRKAVLPVAGLGTRFLPATKAMPKEMLTVVDRPLIQHVVDEAREAGIEHFIFVTGRNKGVIEDHFDRQYELEATLHGKDRKADLEIAREGPARRRPGELHAPAVAARASATRCGARARSSATSRSPCCCPTCWCRPSDLASAQMIDTYKTLGEKSNIIAVEEVPTERVNMYGIVGVGKPHGKAFEITDMVEKPARDKAPSNLSITGRYILQPEIFDILAKGARGAGGEIQLTDAMITLAKKSPFYGLKFDGTSYDCGSKLGFLTANVAYALARPDIAKDFRAELKKLLG